MGADHEGVRDSEGLLLANNTELHALELSGGKEVDALFVNQNDFLWSDFGVENRRALVVGNSAVYGLRCG